MLFETNRNYFLDENPHKELGEFTKIVNNIENGMEKIQLNLINNRLNLNFICDIFIDYINDEFFYFYYDFLKVLKKSMQFLKSTSKNKEENENVRKSLIELISISF